MNSEIYQSSLLLTGSHSASGNNCVPDKYINDDEPTCSHQELIVLVERQVNDIVASDPLLSYLPPNATLEELNSLLALEHGRAMNIFIHRGDGENYSVVVDQDATVLGLKKAIQYHFTMKQSREGSKRLISWKYVWKSYWLYFEGQKLTPDHAKLKDFGIRNNADLTFIKKLRMR